MEDNTERLFSHWYSFLNCNKDGSTNGIAGQRQKIVVNLMNSRGVKIFTSKKFIGDICETGNRLETVSMLCFISFRKKKDRPTYCNGLLVN